MVALTKDEAAMMEQLLAGLDDTLSDYVPTPPKPKPKPTAKPQPKVSPLSQRPTAKMGIALAKSPVRKVQHTPTRKGKNKENPPQARVLPKPMKVDSLLTGAEDWDWADMEAEATAPAVVKGPVLQVSC